MKNILLLFSASSLFFLIWTIVNSFFLPRLRTYTTKARPLVSILVPMRNEEKNAEALVQTLQGLTYEQLEFVMLDDQSTDETWHILQKTTAADARFRLLQGGPLPKKWIGKVHACHQLSQYAKGEYLLFLDADVRLQQATIEKAIAMMEKRKAALLTGFPAFPVTGLLGALLVPLQHFVVYFHLPMPLANYTRWQSTTAAHGAFMLFQADAYRAIGGHYSVQSSLVEDVHITRSMKAAGYRVLLANITDYVSCYMYETNRETWGGFTKNIFIGLGRSVPLALGLSCFYTLFYLFPYALSIFSIWHGIAWCMPALFLWAQRIYVDYMTRQNLLVSILQPFAFAALLALLFYSMLLSLLKKSYYWKGRTYP